MQAPVQADAHLCDITGIIGGFESFNIIFLHPGDCKMVSGI